MNYRRLSPDERFRWGDEFWDNTHHWNQIASVELAFTFVGRHVGGLIARRYVQLMNHDPTEQELSEVPYPYPPKD